MLQYGMLTVVAAIVEQGGRVLACQRRGDAAHPLKWEFPGGKVEAGENLPDALRRELREELGIEARIGPEVARYTCPPLELVFFSVVEFTGEIRNRVFARVEWTARKGLKDYDFLENDLALVQLIGEVEIDQVQ